MRLGSNSYQETLLKVVSNGSINHTHNKHIKQLAGRLNSVNAMSVQRVVELAQSDAMLDAKSTLCNFKLVLYLN